MTESEAKVLEAAKALEVLHQTPPKGWSDYHAERHIKGPAWVCGCDVCHAVRGLR